MSVQTPITMRPPVAPVPLRQDFLGGLFVTAVAVLAYWLAADLPAGTLGGMGPGMMPKALALLLGALGLTLLFGSLWHFGERIRRWSIRGPVFVFGAMIAFGLTVRPLGLVVAGPLAMMIGALASDEVRWGETIVSVALTSAFCVGLFKLALGLPIPLAPWLIGY
ncbi:tripartite tricarboxylate transporter TctB family protein [Xanthobacteraceae bacterium Astr-EGSB]|uniref:tripartite tricarboxylate transporter TctB family protein n=1 Tax=Astrobacterium formosum TaxID=3069710 RepID=UPI0027B6C3AE|nr:tripartite tricarboxylate transporter TctB family protein [Xanthobacteraceae bacterium Astr-EGSB]